MTAAPDLRLLGDIGGTNARFALMAGDGALHDLKVLDCAAHAGLEDAARAYLAECTPNTAPARAAFCVASPVIGDAIAYLSIAVTAGALIAINRRTLGRA